MALQLARTAEEARDHLARNLRNHDIADDRIRDHVRIVTGPQPYRHSYYAADEFMRIDTATGVAGNIYGQRVLRVTGNYLRALHKTIADEMGPRADVALYRLGYRWGEADAKTFAPRVEQEYECEFDKLAMGVMLDSWWWPYRAAGWGAWRYDFGQARNGMVIVELYDSAVAEACGHSDKPVCHLYAGLFAATFGFVAKRELACLEFKCRAKGDPHCQFLVATKRRIDVATAERDDGASINDIIQMLSAMSKS